MRTFIKFIRGIFFIIFLILMLTACTGRDDIVLEPGGRGSGTEGVSETEGESMAENISEEKTESAWETAIESIPGKEEGTKAEAEQETAPPDIYVHICGAVENPGVYVLAAGSRVYEGVAAAGGFREDACEDFINQAGILQDGQRLIIPTVEETEAAREDGSYQALWQEEAQSTGAQMPETADMADNTSGSAGGLVNINTATESELSAIPGIGAGKAAAIIQYRQENGRFASIEEIMKVSGIKEGTFEKIKDKITIN